jgi:hypothetical protein
MQKTSSTHSGCALHHIHHAGCMRIAHVLCCTLLAESFWSQVEAGTLVAIYAEERSTQYSAHLMYAHSSRAACCTAC